MACNKPRRLRWRDDDILPKRKRLLIFSTVAQELLTASRQEETQLSVVCLQPRRPERTIVAAEAPTNVTLKEMNNRAILNELSH